MGRSIPIPPRRGRGVEPDGLPPFVERALWRPDGGERRDRVAVEEPLEIRLDGAPFAVTLRTPGHDEELAAGFLHAEGVLPGPAAIASVVRVEEGPAEARGNVVDVRLAAGANAAIESARPALVTSACGVCGRRTIEGLRRRAPRLPEGPSLATATIASLPDRLRSGQPVFRETGGLHAAGLFTAEGDLRLAREDVGRHNAVDKVIGRALLDGALPLHDRVLLASGRAGFEIAQKAWMAGIPVLASVSAPSHLAVDLAEEAGMTLIGFVRDGGFNVYSGRARVRAARR